MLTSECFYAFPGLATRFLNDGGGAGLMMARALKLHAVDAYVADEWLLVVMPDSVIAMKVEDFAAAYEDRIQETTPQFEAPVWEQVPSFQLEYATIIRFDLFPRLSVRHNEYDGSRRPSRKRNGSCARPLPKSIPVEPAPGSNRDYGFRLCGGLRSISKTRRDCS